MKQDISRVFAVVCGSAWLCVAASVCGQDTGFYAKGDVGGNWTHDIDIENFLGLSLPGTELELEPGFRFGLGGGYRFTDWLAAEVEIGYMANEIDSIPGELDVDYATVGQVPVLLNAKLQIPMGKCPVRPYIGAGLGFSTSYFTVDDLFIRDSQNNETYFVDGSDADVVFAWQAFAGLRYEINKQMGVGVEYRYFQAESPSWDTDSDGWDSPPSDTIEFGRSQTHSVSVVFEFRF